MKKEDDCCPEAINPKTTHLPDEPFLWAIGYKPVSRSSDDSFLYLWQGVLGP